MGDNNIVIKITSEADLDSAQKQMKDLTEQSNRLTEQMEKLKEQEKEDAAAIKKQNLSREAEAKALKRNAQFFREEREYIKGEIADRKKSIKELEKQVKAYKTLNGMSGKAVQQLRAMREELQKMEDAGEFGSQAFIDLSIKAGELEDKIGDVQQRIRVLSSDTKELDAVMGLGEGLAGSFYIATSAAEIFGDDIEGLQKAFYKVQAAMSIVSGITQVYNAVQKDSNANVVIANALSKTKAAVSAKEAVATGKATIAQRIYNKVLMSSPAAVLLATIAALVAAYTIMSDVLGRVGDKQARLNKIQADAQAKSIQDTLQLQTSLMQAQGKTSLEVAEVEAKAAKEILETRQKSFEKAADLLEKANVFNRKKRQEDYDEAKRQRDEASEEWIKAEDNVIVQRRIQEVSNRKLLEQTKVDIMKEGLSREIAQINLNYREQLKTIQGDTELEIALRAKLEAKKTKEIAEVKHRYQQQIDQITLDMMRDGEEKEKAQIEASYKERLRQYQGNSEEEKKMREKLEEQKNQAIADVERKYILEQSKIITETEVAAAEERTKLLTGAEGVEKQKQVWHDYYAERENQIRENARIELEDVERSTDNEQLKAAKREQINKRMQADLNALEKEGREKDLEIDAQYLTDLEIAVEKSEDKMSRAQGTGRLAALKDYNDAQQALYKAQQKELDKQWEGETISFQEYTKRKWEIAKAATDARVQYETDAMQTIADGFQVALGYMQQVSDLAFEALNQNVQAELDALDKMYTTDAAEAAKNADKKYITQKEYEKKKAALEEKQAKYAKAQALINAGINTALAITSAMTTQPFIPLGLAAVVMASAMGAAQMAIIASKPLAQYEKGRKGGKGEYALVGEKGPEIMYVPQGASIVPNNFIATPEAWSKFGVPELPHANPETLHYAAEQTAVGLSIDYDRLGAAVASALPKQRNVTVNVDRSGVHVNNGGDNHTYLNAKYNGSWR